MGVRCAGFMARVVDCSGCVMRECSEEFLLGMTTLGSFFSGDAVEGRSRLDCGLVKEEKEGAMVPAHGDIAGVEDKVYLGTLSVFQRYPTVGYCWRAGRKEGAE